MGFWFYIKIDLLYFDNKEIFTKLMSENYKSKNLDYLDTNMTVAV